MPYPVPARQPAPSQPRCSSAPSQPQTYEEAFKAERATRQGCDLPCNAFAISQGVCACATAAYRATNP